MILSVTTVFIGYISVITTFRLWLILGNDMDYVIIGKGGANFDIDKSS